MPRTSPFRAKPRTTIFFNPCIPEMTKLSACSALLATRRRGIFFCCSNTASSVAPVSMRKVSTWSWPCSEAQRVPFGPGVILGGEPAGQADARAGHRILGEPPADLPLARLDGGGERLALLRAHHAGDRILVPRLIGLHGLRPAAR